MIRNEIIEPTYSPWNSPILLVKRKDNTTRFGCDYRELNKVTKKDAYPFPNIQDVIDRMSGTRYWTTLDAASANWSMPLAEEDRECITCNKCKADQSNPKAPLVPIVVPESPMKFLSIDIAHMETDPEGYRYLLVMGDMFSKYIEAVPMKDQATETIINAIWKAWITKPVIGSG